MELLRPEVVAIQTTTETKHSAPGGMTVTTAAGEEGGREKRGGDTVSQGYE